MIVGSNTICLPGSFTDCISQRIEVMDEAVSYISNRVSRVTSINQIMNNIETRLHLTAARPPQIQNSTIILPECGELCYADQHKANELCKFTTTLDMKGIHLKKLTRNLKRRLRAVLHALP